MDEETKNRLKEVEEVLLYRQKESEDRLIALLQKELKEQREYIHSAFIEADLTGHKTEHAVIRKAKDERDAIVLDTKKHVVKSAVYAFLIFVALAVWNYIGK